MHADHALIPGSVHLASGLVCQDYCLSGDALGYSWAAVADGCSSAGRTDLGARAWVLSAQAAFEESSTPTDLGDVWLDRLMNGLKPWQQLLTPADLLATVGVLCATPDTLTAWLAGDGSVLFKMKDGTVVVHTVQFSLNAPPYLAYWLSESKANQYRNEFSGQTCLIERLELQPSGAICVETQVQAMVGTSPQPWRLVLPLDEHAVEMAMVCTDGVSSLPQGLRAAVSDLSAVRSYQGQFIRRRLGRLFRDWSRSSNTPRDDLAVAGICLV